MNCLHILILLLPIRDEQARQVRLHTVGGLNRVKTMKIIKMLAIVVINFGICWLPLFAIFNFLKFNPSYPDFTGLSISTNSSDVEIDIDSLNVAFKLIPFAQWLGAANSCINPWIYCFYSKRYRRGFKRVFLCRSMRTTSMRYPQRLNSVSANFHRDHNLALRTGADQLAYSQK